MLRCVRNFVLLSSCITSANNVFTTSIISRSAPGVTCPRMSCMLFLHFTNFSPHEANSSFHMPDSSMSPSSSQLQAQRGNLCVTFPSPPSFSSAVKGCFSCAELTHVLPEALNPTCFVLAPNLPALFFVCHHPSKKAVVSTAHGKSALPRSLETHLFLAITVTLFSFHPSTSSVSTFIHSNLLPIVFPPAFSKPSKAFFPPTEHQWSHIVLGCEPTVCVHERVILLRPAFAAQLVFFFGVKSPAGPMLSVRAIFFLVHTFFPIDF